MESARFSTGVMMLTSGAPSFGPTASAFMLLSDDRR